jgi:hypothetical protein
VLKGFAAATTRYACLVAKWQCLLDREESRLLLWYALVRYYESTEKFTLL